MEGFVGITNKVPSKKDVLWFDSIAIPSFHESDYTSDQLSLLGYLVTEKVVEIVSSESIREQLLLDIPEMKKLKGMSSVLDANMTSLLYSLSIQDFKNFSSNFYDLHSRTYSIILSTSSTQAVPMLSSLSGLNIKLPETRETEVANVVIDAFPEPSDETSWESIIDFRKEARFQLLELRRWVRKLAKDDVSLYEAKEELEYLLHDYRRYYEIRKIKQNIGTLSSIVKIPLGLAENIIKIRLEKLTDSLFSLHNQRVELFEFEMNAPGKDVAYIVSLENLVSG